MQHPQRRDGKKKRVGKMNLTTMIAEAKQRIQEVLKGKKVYLAGATGKLKRVPIRKRATHKSKDVI